MPAAGPTDPATARAAARLAWVRDALDEPGAGLERASTDAGFRSYWRTIAHAGPVRVLMDSPPDLEDVRPWLAIRDLLAAGGVRVPAVLARDVDAGFLLLEDLGTHTALQVIAPANTEALFDAALEQLLALQAIVPPAGLPAYDAPLLARELRLFDEWFLVRHLGLVLDDDERKLLQHTYDALIEAALSQPQVLVHRDFMLRNLMPVDGGVAVLDFQDAVRGPIAYDPICLCKDAFVSWPRGHVDAWLERYHARAHAAGLPVPALSRFRHDADWIGVQRHLKVIGIFARLHHRDAKSRYLADVPRFFAYLDEVLPRHPRLAGLHAFLGQRVKPALARIATPGP